MRERRITSRDNPDIRRWKKLSESSRARKEAGLMLIEGLHLITAWRSARKEVLPTLLILGERGAARHAIHSWLEEELRLDGFGECVYLPEALFMKLSGTETPSGALAVAPLPSPAPLAGNLDTLVLDGVQDPGNLGALLRTAAAAGISQAVFSRDCADLWSPKALRAGQGAQFQLNLHADVDLPDFLRAFQGETLATALLDAETLHEAAWPVDTPIAWVFGAEGQGIRASVLEAAKRRIRVFMPGAACRGGAVESLNVTAAAAICLFETLRRRQAAPMK
ncbi:MAG: RNA methyltransferase [Zoogloeaceae bacterium]|jgi:TrmH family RNA methyltransferase|nr:RNA methyltransferase [Zoogloeaceae bacterium]